MRHRDTQRQKVYAAERVLKAGTERDFDTHTQAAAWTRTAVRSLWLRRMFPKAAVVCHPECLVIREKRSGNATGALGGWTIALPPYGRTKLIILHELAHLLTNRYTMDAVHGRDFTATFVKLVRHWLGVEAYRKLRAEFRAKRVKVGQRRTSTRSEPSETERAVLRERFKERLAAAKARQVLAAYGEGI